MLGAAALATALGWAISVAARRRRDARLLLISLAFIASSGFLGLHALATPTVLLGPERGLRARDAVRPRRRGRLRRRVGRRARAASAPGRSCARSALLLGALLALLAAWAVVSLAELPPLDVPLEAEELDGWQLVLAGDRRRPLRPRRTRLRPPLPAPPRALRLRVHARLRAPRGGDGRHRVGAELAALVVGVAHPHARRVPRHRRRRRGPSGTRSASARSTSTRRSPARRTSASSSPTSQGFTSYSERHDPAEVAAMLNAYFERLDPADGGVRAERCTRSSATSSWSSSARTGRRAGSRAARPLARRSCSSRRRDRIAEAHEDWPRFRVG